MALHLADVEGRLNHGDICIVSKKKKKYLIENCFPYNIRIVVGTHVFVHFVLLFVTPIAGILCILWLVY